VINAPILLKSALSVNTVGPLTLGGTVSDDSTARSLAKIGAGVLTVNTANTYKGGTVLTAGTVKLGTDDVMPDSGAVSFAGGIFDANDKNEMLGNLSLTANSQIALHQGGDTGAVTFGAGTWTSGILTITGWSGTPGSAGTDDTIFLASASSDLLANITFQSINGTGPTISGAIRLSSGEIVPAVGAVPEPSTVCAGGVLGVLGVWSERRRLFLLFAGQSP
jgi:autotransporter-associated beta strand protein